MTRNGDSDSCPDLERMLNTMAARVGAQSAMLIEANGTLLASVGFRNQTLAEGLAVGVSTAVAAARLMADELGLSAFVEVAVPDRSARLYARCIANDRILVTVFPPEDPAYHPVRLGSDPMPRSQHTSARDPEHGRRDT